MPFTQRDERFIEEVRTFARQLAAGDEITFDDAMNKIAKWYHHDQLVRTLTFNMVDGYLQDRYGEYWKDTRCPWNPME